MNVLETNLKRKSFHKIYMIQTSKSSVNSAEKRDVENKKSLSETRAPKHVMIYVKKKEI